MDERTKGLIGQLKGRIIELADDHMSEIIREAREEARAEAKAIIRQIMLQTVLERALEELQGTRTTSALAGEVVAPVAQANPSAAGAWTGGPLRRPDDAMGSKEQIQQEIAAIRKRIAENESLLSQISASPVESEPAGEARAEDQPSAPGEGNREACGYYVYAIVGGNGIGPIEGLPEQGIDPACPVYAPSYRHLHAIVSKVSLQEFGQKELEANLNDIRWVEAKVRAHQAVLESVSASHTLIPMRFCTIYRTERRVQEMMAQHYDDLVAALSRLAGKREWGVKAWCDRKVLAQRVEEVSDRVQKLKVEMAQRSSGAAYFVKKRLEETFAEEMERVSDECTQYSHDRLAAHAEEAVINPLQSSEFTGRNEPMLLNGAYLVAEEQLVVFRAELTGLEEEYGHLGFTYRLTGPWPPYNFVSIGLEERAADE